MITDHWPLYGLRITTPGLELRLPTLDDLAQLADLAAAGVHDPAVQPFTVAWTDAEPAERARSVIQYHWGTLAGWRPSDWTLQLVAVAHGRVVGTQGVEARQFGVVREVLTGSWLGLAHQGQGYGTQMRTGILELAFGALGAEFAVSSAFETNAASLGVSYKLGYTDDGVERCAVRDRPVVGRRLRLDRSTWEKCRPFRAELHGVEPCLPLFGL